MARTLSEPRNIKVFESRESNVSDSSAIHNDGTQVPRSHGPRSQMRLLLAPHSGRAPRDHGHGPSIHAAGAR